MGVEKPDGPPLSPNLLQTKDGIKPGSLSLKMSMLASRLGSKRNSTSSLNVMNENILSDSFYL